MKTDSAVDVYIDGALTARQPALLALRSVCVKTLSGCTETMAYAMPSYERDGEVEDIDVVRSMLAATAATTGTVC